VRSVFVLIGFAISGYLHKTKIKKKQPREINTWKIPDL